MTVSELLQRTTSVELTEWKVLFEIQHIEAEHQRAMNR